MLKLISQNFYLLLFIAAFIFLMINLIKNKRNANLYIGSYNLFFTLLYLSLFWIPKGFDITDEGFILSKSWFIWNGMWHENIDKIWGTSIVNGLWLNIIGKPNLLWARIGYAILISTIGIVNYKILILYFKKGEVFLGVLILYLVSFVGFPQTINYHNFPTLLILLSILFFIKGNRKTNRFSLVLSGLLLAFGFYAKITIIVFSIYPIVYLTIWYLKEKKRFIWVGFYTYLGVLIGVIIGIIILLLTNSLNDYLINLFHTIKTPKSSNPTHSLEYLLELYQKDIWLIFSKSLFIGILLILTTILVNKAINRISKFIIIGIVIWMGLYYLKFSPPTDWMFIIISLGFSAFILIVLFGERIKTSKQIVFFSLLMFFFSFIGSGIGFKILLSTGGAILPIASFFIILKSTSFFFNKSEYKFSISVLATAIFFIFLFFDLKPQKIYRDQSGNKLKYDFKSEALIGIKSNKNRVQLVDSLMLFIKNNVKASESVMYIGKIPMLYYLTNKHYFTNDLWRQPSSQFKLNYEEIPDYLVFAIKNPRDFWWPDGNSSSIKENDSLNYLYYNELEKKFCYKIVYKNQMFKVYKKPLSSKIKDSINNGLIAYYPFNGNANDASGNNNHGKVFGASIAKDKKNKKKSAYYFNGKSYIRVKNHNSLNPKEEITLCAWFKPENFIGSGSDPIITKGYLSHTPPFYQYHLSTTGTLYNSEQKGKISFALSTKQQIYSVSSSPNFFNSNNWYFIVGTLNKNVINIYVNGRLIQSNKINDFEKIDDYGLDIYIGKGNNYSGFIKGTIDEVRIYDRALNASEIIYLFKNYN